MKKEINDYSTIEIYEPWPELTESERQEMRAKYEKLLPGYQRKSEIINNQALCPMDVLHNYILKQADLNPVSYNRTVQTQSIREGEKKAKYESGQPTTCQQEHNFDARLYIEHNRATLEKTFNLKMNQ